MAGPIRISILADARNAVRGLNDTTKAATNMQTKLGKTAGVLGKMQGPAVAALGGIAVGAFKAGQAAASMGDSLDASKIILGDAQKSVEKFADSAAKDLGISKQAAIDAANSIGNIGSKAGLTGGNLGKFTTDLIGRAGDVASMFGGPASGAVEAFGSALRGEFEPARKYGVQLDAATLQTAAMKQGIIKNIKTALTPQQKALVIQSEILRQTSKAQGNFAATSDSAKNKQEALKAQLANVTAQMGTALLPIMAKVAGVLSSMATWITKNSTAFKIMVGVIAGVAAVVLTALGVIKVITAVTKVWTAVQAAFNFVMALHPIGLIIIAVVAFIAIIAVLWLKCAKFREIVTAAWNGIKTATIATFNAVKGFLVGVWNNIKAVFTVTFGIIKGAFSGFMGNVRAIWAGISFLWTKAKEVIGKVASVFSGLWGKIKGYVSGIPSKLKQVGQNIMRGLVSGIQKGIQWVRDKISELANLIPDKLKSILGISSPSKVMRKLGQSTIQGFVAGFASISGKQIVKPLLRDLSGVTPTFGGSYSGGFGAGGRTYILNVNVPPTVDQAEIGRTILKAIRANEAATGRVVLA